eukprot:TRINITY_DN10341_c0_g1_i1.p1 TRINITY_DN10341_c0_g1~~TRINITY_DN10341_c0_g1_i1.p1  ORF type:complete len:486 (+),score=7.15 TRINITY_DN10341_c0_g1_i1:206-1663(+)
MSASAPASVFLEQTLRIAHAYLHVHLYNPSSPREQLLECRNDMRKARNLLLQAGACIDHELSRALIDSCCQSVTAVADEMERFLFNCVHPPDLCDVDPQIQAFPVAKRRRESPPATNSRSESAVAPSATGSTWDFEVFDSSSPSLRDVAGNSTAVQVLKECILMPQEKPEVFLAPFRRPWSTILLYGPPGTGKTLLASCVAAESSAAFLSVSSADVLSKWQGQSERLLRSLFTESFGRCIAFDSDGAGPRTIVLFFDEIDAIASCRTDGENDAARRIKTQLLVELTRLSKFAEERAAKFRASNSGAVGFSRFSSVVVIGATNLPWELDPAVRRRFQHRIFVPLPDADARRQLLGRLCGLTADIPAVILCDSELGLLVQRTHGLSGSDIETFCQEVLMLPIRQLDTATHFVRHEVGCTNIFVPCEGALSGAVARDVLGIADLRSRGLFHVAAGMVHFETVLRYFKASVTTADNTRYQEFRDTCGTS